uniref:Uncharacterized protein n=1 Tax=Ascaris lumbricoides TaxID=6252 RepID=A0A9J2P5Z4_ASCLU
MAPLRTNAKKTDVADRTIRNVAHKDRLQRTEVAGLKLSEASTALTKRLCKPTPKQRATQVCVESGTRHIISGVRKAGSEARAAARTNRTGLKVFTFEEHHRHAQSVQREGEKI